MCFLFSFLWADVCYQTSVGRSCDWRANLLLRGGKKVFLFQMKWNSISSFTTKTSKQSYQLSPYSTLQTNHGGELMEIELMWTFLNQSEAVLERHEVSPPCMWLEVVHEDPSHVRCWQPGIGPGTSVPSPFTGWICHTHKPEPRLHMHVDETGTGGWSVPNLSLTRLRCKGRKFGKVC